MPRPRPGEPGGNRNASICSAISRDGLHFVFERGFRVQINEHGVIDPAVIRLHGRWHLTAPRGRPEEGALHFVSADGLDFERVSDIPSKNHFNWTGNLINYGKGVRFYGSSPRGIWWSFSEDGFLWSDSVPVGIQGGDPTVVQTAAGEFLMIYVSR
ncbi:MAG: hypothetical protein D6679_13400 [Candidatus Hydrogenedentota bacterium]|nr:MAG: hypothetical protein D6679_13400 [Candidatus Hydrogenedentota bacterium]